MSQITFDLDRTGLIAVGRNTCWRSNRHGRESRPTLLVRGHTPRICFWSIVVVSLASLLMWLALGGQSSLTASRSLNATGAQHPANGGVGAVEPALDAFGQARPSRTRLDPPCGSPGKIDRTAKPFGASAKSNCDLQPWR